MTRLRYDILMLPAGVTGWMVMEIVSVLSFLATYLLAPFSPDGTPPPLNHTSTLLATLFLLHYLNRAIISPLRSPGRSPTHLLVVICGIIFNLVNPCLMAAFLSSPDTCPRFVKLDSPQKLPPIFPFLPLSSSKFVWTSDTHLFMTSENEATSWTSPNFVFGLIAFGIGLASNILHDEILHDLRRDNPLGPDGKHKYLIPKGYLYDYISYPNYLSEWLEFAGFALAASPRWEYTPPWMFLVAEIMVMLPRAYKGHQWYREKFPDYPKNRKVVIPFIF
jgi:3-oxo-5-alpha-steroid 4-dehydrogenase 1